MNELKQRAERMVDTFPYLMKVFHRFGSGAMSDNEITVAQFRTLAAVSVKSQWMLSELARFLGVKSPAASEIVDRLVKSGWIVRETNPGNRRQTMLSLSPKGKTYFERRRKNVIASYSNMLSQLTPKEQSIFERSILSLAQIATSMEKRERKL